MNPSTVLLILKLLDLLVVGLQLRAQQKAEYEAIAADIRDMIENDVDPTWEQWQALSDRSDALTDQIREAAEAKRPAAG